MTLVGKDRGWWLWRRQMAPGGDPLVIDDYVRDCVAKFAEVWIVMHTVIRRAIEEPSQA